MGAMAQDDDEVGLDPGPEGLGWRTIVSRVLAATVGAYVVCNLLGAAIGKHLPLGKVDAVLISTMIGLCAYIGLVVWVIAAKSILRVWAVLAGLSAMFLVISIV
jgi:hypothetical protein